MSIKILLFSASILLFACGKKQPPKDVKPHQMALVIGNPVSYGDNDLLVFPIGANYNPDILEKDKSGYSFDEDSKETANTMYTNKSSGSFTVNVGDAMLYDQTARQEFVNSNEEDFDMRNILFYNKQTGHSYLLSSDTLHILSFAIHSEFLNQLIFYRVVRKDINKDKKYNSEDAVMLYVSDLEGKNLVKVTPDNEQFFDYFYYQETQSILIKTALDIDQDKRFTQLDETVFREMRLTQPAFGREIFPTSLRDSLKSQISVLK